VRRLLHEERVGTQEELRELLAAEGFDVTQATLSRDLARLSARRVSLPGGGTAYELPEDPPLALLREVRPMVLAVKENGSLVVLRTVPGAAPAVARALDLSGLQDSLGTIAGDDTVFLAPACASAVRAAARRIRFLLRGGEVR
jgi:transcriptional regulator of arginine metabolism